MRCSEFKTKTKKSVILFLALIFCACSLCSCDSRKYKLPKQNLTIQKADGTNVTVLAELAVKTEERNYGFMNRKNIPDGTGMLFVFEKDQVLHFWMKNTPTPLSIAYVLKDGTIVDILDMTPFALSSVSSSRSVRYALEVPQHWFEKNGVNCGDKIQNLP